MAASHWLSLVQSVALHALTLAHTLHVWWLHVAAAQRVQLVDALLLLQVRSLLVVLQARLAGHARYRRLERALRGTFPDAAPGQLADDRCPICLGVMRVRAAGAALLLEAACLVHASLMCTPACLAACPPSTAHPRLTPRPPLDSLLPFRPPSSCRAGTSCTPPACARGCSTAWTRRAPCAERPWTSARCRSSGWPGPGSWPAQRRACSARGRGQPRLQPRPATRSSRPTTVQPWKWQQRPAAAAAQTAR